MKPLKLSTMESLKGGMDTVTLPVHCFTSSGEFFTANFNALGGLNGTGLFCFFGNF